MPVAKASKSAWKPTVGYRQLFQNLARGIKLGASIDYASEGELIYGRDEVSQTWQLWKVVASGKDGVVEFVGFVNPNTKTKS